MNNPHPNIKVSTVYLCSQTGSGLSVEIGQKPTPQQEAIAFVMIAGCEESGGCPEDCQIRMLIERRA